MNFHIWLPIILLSNSPNPFFDWSPPIKQALSFTTNYTSIHNFNIVEEAPLPPHSMKISSQVIAVALPWKRADWKSDVNAKHIKLLHHALRHPSGTSLLELFRQHREGREVP